MIAVGRRGWFSAIAVLLCSVVCARVAAAAEARLGQPVMGTVLQVTVVAEDEATARTLAQDCIREAQHWDDILTTWRPEGELAVLNRHAGQGATVVSGDLRAAIQQMLSLSRATDGAFDPAVGPWVERWRSDQPPSASKPEHIPQMSEVVKIVGDQVDLAAGASLDAGGIGKGIAVDAMVRLLQRAGAKAAFIDFGGSSLHALAAPPDSPSGWIVAISGLNRGEVRGTIALRDASLSTSRASGPGDPAGPIIDPATGQPVPGPRLAVAVAPDGATAEAWSKALIVRGRQALDPAEKSGIDGFIQDGSGATLTPGFEKKLAAGAKDS